MEHPKSLHLFLLHPKCLPRISSLLLWLWEIAQMICTVCPPGILSPTFGFLCHLIWTEALCILNILYTKTRFLTAVTFPAKSLLLTETKSKITSFLAGSVTALLSSMSASTCRNNWALLLLIAFVLQRVSVDRSYFHVVGQLFWLHSYLALWFC